MLTKSQTAKVRKAIDHHESYSSAYFWTPPAIASERRKAEHRGTLDVELTHRGHRYEYHAHVDYSCRNVRYSGRFLVDGQKRTVTAFRHLLS